MKKSAITELLFGNSLRLTGVVCCILFMSGCCKIFDGGNRFTKENQTALYGKDYIPKIKGLNTQGYFYGNNDHGWYEALVLYPDGTAIDYTGSKLYDSLKGKYLPTLDALINDTHFSRFIYSQRNDTLILDNYLHLCNGRYLTSRYYFIEDKNTLRFFKYIYYPEKGKTGSVINKNEVLHLVPVDTLPNMPEPWLKKQKWMWENEDEWKDYKRELKARKDSIKRARKLKTNH